MPAPRPLSPLNLNIQIPLHFRCPISLELMKDPVILCTGQTYDRSSIEKWVASGNTTCPVTMQKLDDFITFIPNHTLRRLIQEWCVANRSRGVERIPTPKQPADLNTIRAFMAELAPTCGSGEDADENEVGRRISALRSLRNLAKEGEKNRALMVEAGVVPAVLAAVFDGIKEEDEEERGETNTDEEEEEEDTEEEEEEEEAETEGSCSSSSDGDGDVDSILYKIDLKKSSKTKKKKKKGRSAKKPSPSPSPSPLPLICGSVAEEALATIVTLPIRDAERCEAATPRRLRFLSEVLRGARSMETRVNAASLIEMMSDSREHQEMRVKLAMTEGIMEGLVELLRLQNKQKQEQGDPAARSGGASEAAAMAMATKKAAKASSSRCVKVAIKALFSLCLRRQGKERAVEAGAPAALIERLPETVADRGDAERALGAIELLCTTEGGVMAVAGHAMSVPLLVRLILKVSGRATEFATGSLLAICSSSERLQREAVRAGIVKELLLLMQSDCTHRAKTKAMNLLKLLRGSYDQSVMPEYGRTDVVPF